MAESDRWLDTPSVVDRVIARHGQSLRYAELAGREKRDHLFDQGIRPTAYADEDLPSVDTGIVRFLSWAWASFRYGRLPETLLRVGDELERPKPKLFHTYGSTAKIRFTPDPDTPYTGVLAETAYGLARFSYAGPVLGVGVVPGLALKFPIGGDRPSENLVAMRKLDRQQPLRRFLSKRTHNSVFQETFTNILPLPRLTNLIMQIVNRRFETVVEKGRGLHQPPDNLARVDTGGREVPEHALSAPYRILFVPTRQARQASDPTVDFRLDLARNIRPESPIYEVFGLSESQESALRAEGVSAPEEMAQRARKAGTITAESGFIASRYGDFRLFFRHSDVWIRADQRGQAEPTGRRPGAPATGG